MYVSAIVLAAGKGLRFQSSIPKPLVKIYSKPLFIYCLEVFNRHPLVKEIIVVANRKNLKGITGKIKKYSITKVKKIVAGGKLRQDSVREGLKAISQKANLILVHDAARPFIDKKIVSLAINEAKKYGASIVGVPVKATIKEVQSSFTIKKTLNREKLWEAQTPQVFKKGLILKAYEKFSNIKVTDDAALVEKLGQKVRIVLGAYNNIKITTPEDLVIAKAIYGQNRNRLRYSSIN